MLSSLLLKYAAFDVEEEYSTFVVVVDELVAMMVWVPSLHHVSFLEEVYLY